jgi:alkylation response protein AidB-like acyl-CoA dehydrogenase
LLLLGAVLCEASYAVIGKKLTGALSPRRITALINLWGWLLSTPMGLWLAWHFDFGAVGVGTWALLLFYALAASVWTVWLWMTGLRSVPAAQAGVFTVLLPISAALVGVLVPDAAGGPPEYFQCVVPRADFVIHHDSWDVVALKGTGSKDISIEHCFVPTHRMFSLTRVAQGYAPGREINPGPLYRQPFFAASVCSLIAPAWGAALAALDGFEARLQSRMMVFGGGKQAEKSTALLRLVEASAEIDAAGLLLRRNCDAFKALAEAGEVSSKVQNAKALFEGAYATTLLTRAVERLFVASGGSALHEGNVIQRCWRDVHAVNSHAGMNFDNMGELYGQLRLGQDVEHGLI